MKYVREGGRKSVRYEGVMGMRIRLSSRSPMLHEPKSFSRHYPESHMLDRPKRFCPESTWWIDKNDYPPESPTLDKPKRPAFGIPIIDRLKRLPPESPMLDKPKRLVFGIPIIDRPKRLPPGSPMLDEPT